MCSDVWVWCHSVAWFSTTRPAAVYDTPVRLPARAYKNTWIVVEIVSAPWIVQYAQLSRYLRTNPRFLMFNELVGKLVWIFDINPGRRWQWHWVGWGKGGRRVGSFFSSRTKCDSAWAWKKDGGRLRCTVLNTDASPFLSCRIPH
jgi:hypothetical protein